MKVSTPLQEPVRNHYIALEPTFTSAPEQTYYPPPPPQPDYASMQNLWESMYDEQLRQAGEFHTFQEEQLRQSGQLHAIQEEQLRQAQELTNIRADFRNMDDRQGRFESLQNQHARMMRRIHEYHMRQGNLGCHPPSPPRRQ